MQLDEDSLDHDLDVLFKVAMHVGDEVSRWRHPELRADQNGLIRLAVLREVEQDRVFTFMRVEHVLEAVQIAEGLMRVEVDVHHGCVGNSSH